jgi:hypothetical protein
MSRLVQYLYFLRFSIVLWLVLPIFVVADWTGVSASMTRGIFALESAQQILWTTFFVLTANFVVLITARVVCVNGNDRFAVAPPTVLATGLGTGAHNHTWFALFVVQIPGVFSLIYVGARTVREGSMGILLFSVSALLGVLAVLAFWYVISLFYYWTYSRPGGEHRLSESAQPLIFPPRWFAALESCPHPPIANIVNRICGLPAKLSFNGYAANAKAPVWELHFFSAVSLIGFLLLYLSLLPVNAPVSVPWGMRSLFWSVVIPAVVVFLGILKAQTDRRPAKITKWLFLVASLSLVASWFVAVVTGRVPREERGMPTLASALVLLIFLTWLLTMLAFFADRFRLPVLTLAVLLVFALKLLPLGTEEHYFSAITLAPNLATTVAPYPSDVLWKRIEAHRGAPIIIVTATGGGIHAAAWTAEVLGDLEKQFASKPGLIKVGYSFHDHVTLISSVSGGSVGAISFLREYTGPTPFQSSNGGEDIRERITNAANCSSLEAVAWGLEYFDFTNFLFTLLPPPASGADEQDGMVVGQDRSWALEAAFNRNQNDSHCGTFGTLQATGTEDSEHMTLARSVGPLLANRLPAFTLNTTVSETGNRFLLSNYQLPMQPDHRADILPAESFLHVYGQPGADDVGAFHPYYADLSLASAARLSATFPYVSSASRIPGKFSRNAFHFVDGGYFDNDGTSSVIEFLSSALSDPRFSQSLRNSNDGHGKDQSNAAKIPVLLIEIRNGWDLTPTNNADDFVHQASLAESNGHYVQQRTAPWRSLQQLMAPPKTLWFAGHDSISRRNRRELCFLEQAYRNEISLHHLVFDYENQKDIHQPLNWHLTDSQKELIRQEARSLRIQRRLQDAAEWTQRVLTSGLHNADEEQICRVANPE